MRTRKGLDVQLKRLRTSLGMTQKDLADILNIGQTAIANYERGKRFPDEKNLISLADCFNISIDQLLGRKEYQRGKLSNTRLKNGFDYKPSELSLKKTDFINSALRSIDEGTRIILNLIEEGYSEEQIMLDLIEPSLIETGKRWAEGTFNEAMEHQISMTALHSMFIMKSLNGKGKVNRGKCVSLTASGENHNLGLWMFSRFLEIDGWENYFLGSSVPAKSLMDFIKESGIRLVLISLTLNENSNSVCSLIGGVKSLKNSPAVLVGGAGTLNNKKNIIDAGADYISGSIPETINWTRSLLLL